MTTILKEQTVEPYQAETKIGLQPRVRWREVTVGSALAGIVVIAAALARLFALGSRPLTGPEAARALAALHLVQGQPVDLAPFSPLLTNLNLLVFFLASAGDFWARLVPALFGIALVALPVVRFRHRLGTGGALAASVLVAVSPTFLLFSRAVDPALLSAVTSLVFAGALFDLIEGQERRTLLIAAGALALALTAGPGTYTMLLFLLLFGIGVWGWHRFRGAAGWDRISAACQAVGRDHVGLAQAAAVFGVTLVVAATGFLVNFGGIQATLNMLVNWLSSFSLTREYPAWYYTGILLLYEPAILLGGLLGAAVAIHRRDLFGLFLVVWFAGGLVLYTAIGATAPSLMVPILLPLVVLAGWGIASMSVFPNVEEVLRALLVAAFVLPLLVYVMLQLVTYTETPAQPVRLYLALGAAATAVIVVLIFASSRFGMAWHPTTVARGAAISLLLTSLGLTVHMAWPLNFANREPVRELLLSEPTPPSIRQMLSVLETVSQDRVGDTVSIPITVDGRLGPLVPWYLRDFTNVTVVDGVRQPPGTPVVIMPAMEKLPPIGGQYVGQAFRFSSRWRPAGLSGGDLARWYFWREGPAVPNDELILFVARQ